MGMMYNMGNFMLLTLWMLLLNNARLVKACASQTTSIFDAILHDGNGAHQTADQYDATQQELFGLMNSACNIEQYNYLALESAYNDALFLDAMCYKEFYVTATTLTDVNVWLTCENMALGVVLPIFYAENDYSAANFDALGQKCTFCADAPSPPVSLPVQLTDPQHTRGLKTIKMVLDWSNRLYNVQGLGLRKSLEAILVKTITKEVRKGAILGAKNLIETHITKGYNPPNSTLSRRDGNSTDPAFQYMNSSIEITATFQMVAFEPNYTLADLQTELDGALKSANFTKLMEAINANVTDQSFVTTVVAAISSTATGTGVATSSVTGTGTGTGTGTVAASSTSKSEGNRGLGHGVESWSLFFGGLVIAAMAIL